ncbi:hypothetical protein BJX70DRAFT_400091 [Aspergillus crustosus]
MADSTILLDLSAAISNAALTITRHNLQYHDITAIAVIVEFDLARHVPLDTDISFKELSLASGAPFGRLERVLRLLFVRRIFHEPRPGYVTHTTVSERLVTNPDLTAFLGHCTLDW